MDFRQTSRKCDMESLCYLMFYLLNGLEMPALDQCHYGKPDEAMDTYQVFKILKGLKEQKSLTQMSQQLNFQVGKNFYKKSK